MKKALALLLVLAMVFSMTACGGSPKQSTGETKSGPTYVLKWSHSSSENAPIHRTAEYIKKYVEEKTNGDMTIEIYPANQLYNDKTEVDAVIAGNCQIISTTLGKMTSLDPDAEFVNAPYLFNDTDEMVAFFSDETVQQKIFGKFRDAGITVLGGFYNGFHYYLSTEKPIFTVEDWKGLNCRDSGGAMVEAMYKAVGTSMVVVSYSELYTAMDSHLVDFCNCSLDGTTGISLQDILKYAINLDQQQSLYLCQVNSEYFNRLPAEYQQILRDAVKEGSAYNTKIIYEERDVELKKITDAGVEVVEADEATKNAFKEKWAPIVDEYVNDTWKEALATFRATYKK